MDDFKTTIPQALTRIQAHIRNTPLEHSLLLSQQTGANVYLKCENLQHTGAFKVRGAFNKLLSLSPAQRQAGVVAASSGNHGAAVAYACQQLQAPALVFVPEYAAKTKVRNIRQYGADVRFYGDDCLLTENHARAYADEHGMPYLSPYNDEQVIAGQGTLAYEILAQTDPIDSILVPIGGGGLIAGIAGYLKSVAPHIEVIGCLPQHSPVMAASIKAGHIVDMPCQATLSDATAGGIEAGSITFPLCQRYVDDYVLVEEQSIADAIITLLDLHHLVIEGAAGVAVGALLNNPQRFTGKNVVVVLCGGNLDLKTLHELTANSTLVRETI